MQKCQKCVLISNVHHIKWLLISYANQSKLRPWWECPMHQSLHSSYTNMAKLRPHCKCPPYQSLHIHHAKFPKMRLPNTTLHFWYGVHQFNTTQHASIHYTFLCKHVKIASMHNCPPIQHCTFLTKTSQNCAHHTTHHTCYTNKCPLYQSLYIYYTNKPKLRPPNVHYINHYTFTIQTSQNCAHQMSTVSIATHLLCKQAKIALTKQITTLLLHKKGHSAGFEPTPTDFNSVAAGHQISSLLWWSIRFLLWWDNRLARNSWTNCWGEYPWVDARPHFNNKNVVRQVSNPR